MTRSGWSQLLDTDQLSSANDISSLLCNSGFDYIVKSCEAFNCNCFYLFSFLCVFYVFFFLVLSFFLMCIFCIINRMRMNDVYN